MRLFRSRHDLDGRLRRERPRPSDELVRSVEARLNSARPAPRRRGRLGLAVAMTLILSLGLTVTGSMSYAASAVKAGPIALKKLVVPSTSKANKSSKASARAAAPAPKVQICHIPPGNPANAHSISISSNALSAHLAHGDTRGACAAGPGGDQYEEKVLICHRPPGNPSRAHTIRVAPSAVRAHLAHGDSLGPCA